MSTKPTRNPRRSLRRSPIFRFLLLASALFLMGGVYSLATPATSSAAPAAPAEVAQGQALFTMNCSSCHGMQGQGTSQGPDIRNAGAAAAHFQVSSGRMPMANQGVQSRRKVNTFTDAEVKAIADYVGSLGTGPKIPSNSQYDPSGLTDEELARGGELFRTNCSACHNFGGNGGALPNGVYAPPLTAAAGVTNQQIWEALRTGPGQMPVFPQSSMTDEDVRQIIGYLNDFHERPTGGNTLGSVGPVSEGLAAWILGIGGCVGFAIWIASKGARAR